MLQALTIASIGIQNFASFFDKWIPGVLWRHTVKAQGGPNTPSRVVLHAALAAVFGMAVHRKFSKIEITAEIDHNNNSVLVTYSVGVDGMDTVLEWVYDAAYELAQDVVLPPIIGGSTDSNDPSKTNTGRLQSSTLVLGGVGVAGVGIAATVAIKGESWIKKYINNHTLARFIPSLQTDTGDSDLDKKIAESQARINADNAKKQQKILDNTSKAINPGGGTMQPPNGTVTRGTNKAVTADNPALPWIITRTVINIANQKSLKDAVAKQREAQTSYENGYKSLFNLASEEIYADNMPFIFQLGGDNAPEPFAKMIVTHGREKGTPFLTRSDAVNPQLPQAMGVDIKTLVAQVLFDPGTWPPLPNTDQGPATIVNTNRN